MKLRAIVVVLALVGAAGWWALRSVRTPEPEPREAFPTRVASEPLATARPGDPSATRTPALSTDPLARQAERLRDTSARLAMRRAQAKAKGAPEITIRALDAHMERLERQLAALGRDAPN